MQFGLVISKVAAVGCIAFLPVLHIGCSGADQDPAEHSAEAVGTLQRGASDNVSSPQSDSVPPDQDFTVTCPTNGTGGKCTGACFDTATLQVGPNDFCHYHVTSATCNLNGNTATITCGYTIDPGAHPRKCPLTTGTSQGCSGT